MYRCLYQLSSGNVINLIVFFYLILIQIKNNVFDQKEYIKAVVFRVGWPTQNNRQKKSKFHNLKIFGY